MTNLDKSKLDSLRQEEDLKLRNNLEETETLSQQILNEMINAQETEMVKTIITDLDNSSKLTKRTLTALHYQRSIGKTYAFNLDTGHVVRITVEEDINSLSYKGEQFLEENND